MFYDSVNVGRPLLHNCTAVERCVPEIQRRIFSVNIITINMTKETCLSFTLTIVRFDRKGDSHFVGCYVYGLSRVPIIFFSFTESYYYQISAVINSLLSAMK